MVHTACRLPAVNFFVAFVAPPERPLRKDWSADYEAFPRAHGLNFRWHEVGDLQVLMGRDDSTPELAEREIVIASYAGWVGVGTVRLDNRSQVGTRPDGGDSKLTDFDLVIRLIDRFGPSRAADLLGDFAFVVWHAASAQWVAACDIFAVKKMYYAERQCGLTFSSRAEALTKEHEYDAQYLAEAVSYCIPEGHRTVYSGVSKVPPATVMIWQGGQPRQNRYWSAFDFEPGLRRRRYQGDAIDECRYLLSTAVRSRLSVREDTWAQLSGGLDSSSIVSVASWMARDYGEKGLAGTISFVDGHGTGGDERRYSDAVTKHYAVPNHTIADSVIWEDDGLPPPRMDQPSGIYPMYVRDRRLTQLVACNRGTVLLTGQGGDELFLGNMFFFADWLYAGHVFSAVTEMARRAAIGRTSFWQLAYKNAVLPMAPTQIQSHLVREDGRMPNWVAREVAERFDLRKRSVAAQSYAGRLGRKFSDAVACMIDAIPAKLVSGVIEDSLAVRHPYLYRPLVEFALQLPPELTVRPYGRKWILRQAMRGILPELVRARIGKGVMYGLLAWSAAKHHEQLELLASNSVLAQLGIIDSQRLRNAINGARYERDRGYNTSPDIQHTLSIEAWLQARSGRWRMGRS